MDTRSAPSYRHRLIALACLAAQALVLATLALPDLAGAQERELGMAVIGNRELPKSLVIVPWKSPEFRAGSGLSLQSLVGRTLQPLDPETLRRELRYSLSESNTPDR